MFNLTIKYRVTSSSGLIACGFVDLQTQNPELALEAFKKEHPEVFIYYAEAKNIFQPDLSNAVDYYINHCLVEINKSKKKKKRKGVLK